jgi:hypothetical protein
MARRHHQPAGRRDAGNAEIGEAGRHALRACRALQLTRQETGRVTAASPKALNPANEQNLQQGA